ncbi:MAG: transporter substrate-binding domain-containing protein [Thermodesulfobacteriota bacterium]
MPKMLVMLLLFFFFCLNVSAEPKTDITVGGDHNYPPYEFVKNGKPAGFNVELLAAAAELAGYNVNFKLSKWADSVKKLEAGKIDAITGMYFSEERDEKFDFSLPYLLVSPGIFTSADSKIKNLSDLEGIRLGVQNKDIMHSYAENNYKNTRLEIFPDPYSALLNLAKKKTDAVLLSSKMQGAYYISEKNINNLKYFNADLPPLRYCFAVNSGNQALLEKLNESLFILKTDGTYNKLYKKWFGKYEKDERYKDLILYISIVSGIFIVLFICALIFSWSLGRKVEQKTRELSGEISRRIKAEEQMKITLESIGDFVITVDKNKQLIWLNPAAEKILGKSLNQVKGKLVKDLIKLKNLNGKELGLSLDKVLEKGENIIPEQPLVFELSSGEEFIISVTGAPLKTRNGSITGGVFVLKDMTKEYDLEKKLHHSQKMDALGRLAGGVAHDFNNVLSAILGAAEILEYKLKQSPDDLAFVNILKKSCERASDLTTKLLSFSKKSPMEMKEASVHEVINNAVLILNHSITPDIKIETFLDAEKYKTLLNTSGMENVLINLGLNSRDAMPGGGSLSIGTENTFLGTEYCSLSPFEIEPGEYILIYVKDTGTGIPLAMQKKVFEPFFTTREKGTGLGLSSVYGMIQQHQGAVTVYSEPGKGTQFYIYLPLKKFGLDKEGKKDNKSPDSVKKAGTILFADDEEMIRKVAEGILTNNGYKVITAVNGYDALEKYKENINQTDLVILDVIMPDMDGRECLKEIKALNPDAKIIISSGFYKNSTQSIFAEEGASGFIKKPYTSDHLLEKILEFI